ncbi:hypothetical protein ACEQ8H_004094 [Pleosporales sp. CAS-2024a]
MQTDLLQVGMRVRKSVPEGYKTHASKMMALPSIHTTVTCTMPAQHRAPVAMAVPEPAAHQRELMPFCGLHKMGGYAEQPTRGEIWYLPAETFTQPFHPGSHDSGYESVHDPVNANPSKRSWHDEDDLKLRVSTAALTWGKASHVVTVDEVPVSPMSETPESMLPAVRPIKMPKSRRRRAEAHVAHRVAAGSGSDFEEADFLGSEEVVMGGV